MATVQDTVLLVPDISCEHCVSAINGALQELPGIETVATDIPTKSVHLRYDPTKISLAKVEEVLDDVGYTVAN